MLQSSASNILNILNSKPVVSESAPQQATAFSPQDADFNKIYSDVGRAQEASAQAAGAKGGGQGYRAPETEAPADLSISAGLTEAESTTPEISTELPDGQTTAVTSLEAGNGLPFQLLMPTSSLLQNPELDGAMTDDWQTLLSASGLPSSTIASNQLLGADGLAASMAVQTDSGAEPGSFTSLQGSANASALLLSTDQVSTSESIAAQLAATTVNGTSSGASPNLTDPSMTLLSPELATGMALAGASDTPAKTGKGPEGLFVPSGLAKAISHGAQGVMNSVAIDGVPGNPANDPSALLQAGQGVELTEGLDSQWLERIRHFQQAQQSAANSTSAPGYDNASLMDAYLASGDMSMQSGALSADSLFQDAISALDVDTLSVQDKSSSTSSSLSGLTTAQLRAADPALKTYTMMVPQPVNDPQWIDSMGEKIVWLSGRNLQSAEIHLNPAELGPVEVKVQVQNDQTTVTFTVQHASVRELLEANVHRLREMMEGNGVNLRDVQVGADTTGQQQAFARNGDEAESGSGRGSGSRGGEDAIDGALTEIGTSAVSSRNVIDFYA